MLRRPRRNRKSETIRNLVAETSLSVNDLIYPVFLTAGHNVKTEIPSMPSIFRLSTDNVIKEIESCIQSGIKTFAIFPHYEETLKDSYATEAYNRNGLYLTALRTIKEKVPEACIMTDIAMDPYSSDGHDGIVKDGQILNDETLEILGKMALAQAETGIDIVGPSDMMDGRVAYIRNILDQNQYTDVAIMAYTAKYASSFYGPFRDALDSAPKGGNKKTYQMNPANHREALMEAKLDFDEGADFLMVKPALPYLDVIKSLSDHYTIPVAAYHVSGEYAMIKAGAGNGWIDGKEVMLESLLSIKRAGASIILTYFAKEAAEIMNTQ